VDIEDEAVEIGDQLTRDVMNLSLGDQSQQAAPRLLFAPI
jgi:hypothetical protein